MPRKDEFPASAEDLALIEAGKWILTLAESDGCASCGFPPKGWHYVNRHGEHHCVTCHAIGKDWARADDSERPIEGIHYV